MSHFTVLVTADNREQLEERLAPFDEGANGPTRFHVHTPIDDLEGSKELYEEWRKDNPNSIMTFDEWMEDDGLEFKYGTWGYLSNPNAKWDWWLIGGRWSGTLLLKEGTERSYDSEESGLGTPGVFGRDSSVSLDLARADYARKGDIDWDGLVQEEIDNATERNKRLAEQLKEWRERNPDEEEVPAFFEEQPIPEGRIPITFAFIDENGDWHQKAQMGWWAMTSDPNDDYAEDFWQFIDRLPDDQMLFVVDCHI